MTFASTIDAEKAKAKMHNAIVSGRKIEVNDATERVQNKKPATNSLNNLNNLNTNLMNKNLVNLVAAGLNPSNLPALLNLNRLANLNNLNMLGNLVAVQQPLVKQPNLNATNLNTTDLNTALNTANLTSQSVLNTADYANTIAQLSSNLTQNNLANPMLLNNLVAAAVANSNEQASQHQFNFMQPAQNSPTIQHNSANKYNGSPNVTFNPNTTPNVQLSPNASNVCSTNYLNNLINNQLLAQLSQSNHLHYQNNLNTPSNSHVSTTSSNLTLNLPTGK